MKKSYLLSIIKWIFVSTLLVCSFNVCFGSTVDSAQVNNTANGIILLYSYISGWLSPTVLKWISSILAVLYVFEQLIVKMNWTPLWANSNSTFQLLWNVGIKIVEAFGKPKESK